MAKPRELRRRIKSVQSTRKITKTMELVATSKLKRAQDRVIAARPYAAALAEVMGDLYAPELAERFPLLRQPRAPEPGVSRRVALMAEHAAEIVGSLMAQFESGALDAVEVVFARFKSAVSTPPTTLRILPIAPPRAAEGGRGRQRAVNYILKPSAEAILEQLLPLYVRNQIYRALVETAAAFLGAQRTAMKNATDNAGEIIELLQRTYNRARQAQITQELAEIVGGADRRRGGSVERLGVGCQVSGARFGTSDTRHLIPDT